MEPAFILYASTWLHSFSETIDMVYMKVSTFILIWMIFTLCQQKFRKTDIKSYWEWSRILGRFENGWILNYYEVAVRKIIIVLCTCVHGCLKLNLILSWSRFYLYSLWRFKSRIFLTILGCACLADVALAVALGIVSSNKGTRECNLFVRYSQFLH